MRAKFSARNKSKNRVGSILNHTPDDTPDDTPNDTPNEIVSLVLLFGGKMAEIGHEKASILKNFFVEFIFCTLF